MIFVARLEEPIGGGQILWSAFYKIMQSKKCFNKAVCRAQMEQKYEFFSQILECSNLHESNIQKAPTVALYPKIVSEARKARGGEEGRK